MASGGVPHLRRQGLLLRVRVLRRAGHAVRRRRPALLPRLLHRGLHRLHLRQRTLPVQGLRAALDGAAVRIGGGARAAWAVRAHRLRVRQLPGDRHGDALRRASHGAVLPDRVRLHLLRQRHRARRMGRLGPRQQQEHDGVLRDVQELGPRRRCRARRDVGAGARLLHRPPVPGQELRQRIPLALTGCLNSEAVSSTTRLQQTRCTSQA